MKKFIVPIIVSLFSLQLTAQTELQTKSISVFKNGQAFVMKEGKVSTKNSVYTLNNVPNALFGTLWFVGLQSDIVSVVSKQEEIEKQLESKAISFRDLLCANKGKPFTLVTNDEKIYTGILEDSDTQNNADDPLLIKTNDKWIAIIPSSIKSIEFSEKPAKNLISSSKNVKNDIEIKFSKSGEQSLKMMYLQNNISWVPTYLLELQSETDARLSLQAEFINNAEDIANTTIHFVVGVPHFKYSNNPATLTPFMTQMSRNIGDYNYGNIFSNTVMSQTTYYPTIDEVSIANVVGEGEANVSEDFYFYTINDITLKKGGRAYYPLFDTPITIKHLYECKLPSRNEQSYRRSAQNSTFSFETQYCNVFHSIEVKNSSKNPFTTGSVMIIDAKTQRPLSQSLLTYTACGQKSSIELSQSPDIKVEEQEKIISSEQEIRIWKGVNRQYTLLKVESEVVIVNSKKHAIEMVIHKSLAGKSINATINYDSQQIPGDHINPQDLLNFKLNIKSGETIRFSYTYEVYIPVE